MANNIHAVSDENLVSISLTIRGIAPIRGEAAGPTLLSFCEALASDTLKQGLKEGLNRTNDSTFLKVKVPKPPRRHSLLQGQAGKQFEPNCVDVKFPVTKDSYQSKPHVVEELSTDEGVGCLEDRKSVNTNRNTEFVALNVQALEQLNISCPSEMFQCIDPDEIKVPSSSKVVHDIVRSATDFDIKSKRNGNGYRRPGYDPCSIYDIIEFPTDVHNEPLTSTMRSASASGHLVSTTPAPQVPSEMVSFLEEPLLLVGPKLEWEGHVNARKMSIAKRRKRQQQMTPQEQKKLTRVVIGYTLAFFLLVIVTFYIVYFV